MNNFFKRLAHDATVPLEDMLGRLVKKFALIIMAVGCVIAASAFLTVDLFLYIESVSSPVVAAGSIAGFYAVFALLFFSLALRRPAVVETGAPPPQTVAALMEPANPALLSAPSAAARPTAAQFAANLDTIASPILDALREAGMQKEAKAVEAGTQVAKQLGPFSLVVMAAGAGVFLGRTLGSKRKLL
ncbi:conserved hypothetical protein [Methylocella silvestris BL2]|uniref:Holin-X, holin superfamily III n=1 Tax=Methylocella silvestris (strain DSM 15510 / CIP 108128 / LMG 27833 / NCIMB 13906 / BL2) TaxID=395965 RepID=B8EP28_METSB|nr:hypothetical protein [Methylocella silvestris]ACK49266.1 conserved hypothetical protein [Methylocella silvestris BL2]